MSAQETIQQLRKQIMSQIGTAAESGLTSEIARLATLAKACDAALQMANDLDGEVIRIAEELTDMNRSHSSLVQPVAHLPASLSGNQHRKTGARERGRNARTKWIDKAAQKHGIRLQRLGEVTYKTPLGKTVAISYASEDPGRTYQYWLGLPDTQPDYVVLLCEEQIGALVDFVFPPEFVGKIWKSLSKDANHHVKFHLLHTGPNWEMKLKNGPLVPITQYKEQSGLLRS